jgi:hypothetical protein
MKIFLLSVTAIFFVFLFLGGAVANPPAPGYHLLKKVPLTAAEGGGEYFDYITFDPSARRIYISHGTEFRVVNADSAVEVGTIKGLKRCHGIALVNQLGKGFITDGENGTVVIVDLKTLKTIGEVKTAPDTDAILYDAASNRVFSFNGDGHNASAIDPKTGTVVGMIDLGGVPENAVADGKGTIYNNNEEKNDVVVIDSKKMTIKTRWPVSPAGGPTAIAMDLKHHRIFTAGRDPQKLIIMNADNGKVIQSFDISAGVDSAVYEPETGLVFCSTREGKVHIFHEDTPDKFTAVETIQTEFGAKTMALDPKTHNLYLTTSDFGKAPAPTAEHPHPRPPAIPGTFRLLIYGRP